MENKKGIHFDGVINIRKEEEGKEPIIEKYYNTMSTHAQNTVLALSLGMLMQANTNVPYNNLGYVIPGLWNPNSDFSNFRMYRNSDTKMYLTVFFLKLDSDELANLNEDSKYIDIFKPDGSLSSKVVAYGTLDDISDSKKGKLWFPEDDKTTEMNSLANGWLFEADKNAFEYNCIAIANMNDNIKDFATYKCIIKTNLNQTNAANGYKYILPGFSDITAKDELVLCYSYDAKSYWRYNLTTGKTTEITEDDAKYSVIVNIFANYIDEYTYKEIVYNDVLFTSTRSYMYAVWPDGSIYKYNNYVPRFFFVYNDELYMSMQNTIYKITIDNENKKFSYNSVDKSTMLGNIPSVYSNIIVKGSYKENDQWYYVIGEYYYDSDKISNLNIICTDLQDIENTIVADAPFFDSVINIDNTESGTYFITRSYYSNYYEYDYSDSYKNRTLLPYISKDYNNYNTKGQTGVYVNHNSYANFLSFEKFDTLQTKTISQNLYITYGYEIGSN